MKDSHGGQVTGVIPQLAIFTLVGVGVGLGAIVYGVAHGGVRGVTLIILGVVALAGMIFTWASIARTQRRRRDVEPPS